MIEVLSSSRAHELNGQHPEKVADKFAWLKELLPGTYQTIGEYLVGLAVVMPTSATTIIEHYNEHNRNPIARNIVKLARAIDEGRFLLNGETIVFDEEGMIRNGQNRMRACIRANKPFETFVIAGVRCSVLKTFDQHQKRTPAQYLQMRGEKNAMTLAASLDYVRTFFCEGVVRASGRETASIIDDLLDTLAAHPGLRQSAEFVRRAGTKASHRFGGSGQLCALHYLFTATRPARAELFLDAVASCSAAIDQEWLPARMLTSLLVEDVAHGDRLTRLQKAALTIKAWNAFGEQGILPKHKLKFAAGEPFPHILDYEYSESNVPSLCVAGIEE
jgi:hypothetical protein